MGVTCRMSVSGSAHAEQVAEDDHALGEKGRSDPEWRAVDHSSSVMLHNAHRVCRRCHSFSFCMIPVFFLHTLLPSQFKIKARRRRRERVLVSSQSKERLGSRGMSRLLTSPFLRKCL